ncbi:MAG: hypothetical protein V7776_23085 [Halopseudomonas aestusnigri]
MNNLIEILVLLIAQNIKAGVIGKAVSYSTLAYKLSSKNQSVNELYAYTCLLSGNFEETSKIITRWVSEGGEMTHNFLIIQSYVQMQQQDAEETPKTLQKLLIMNNVTRGGG